MANNSKILIYILGGFVIIVLLLAASKNLNNHYEKQYLVIDNKIKEAAKKCYEENNCEGNITLKDLYTKEYIEIQYDPKTKEKMDENKCITYDNKEINFCS